MSVTLNPITITPAEFKTAPEDERVFYLKLGSITNEVNMLNKLAMFSLNNPTEELVVNRASSAMAMLQLRLLAGRLYEAREVITTGYKPLKLKYRKGMKSGGTLAYGMFNGYFDDKNNLIKAMRHKLAFHTDPSAFAKGISLIEDDDELTDYMCTNRGNSLFWSGELAIVTTLRHLTGLSDSTAAYRKMLADLHLVSKQLNDFSFAYATTFYDRHFPDKRKHARDNEIILECAPLNEMQLGFFYSVARDAR